MSCKTDRDRLIEILDKSFAEQYEKRGLLTAQHTADDLLANGVIVPPFKVGTKVYVITSQTSDNKNFYIFEDTISHYFIGYNFPTMCFKNHLGIPNYNWDKVFPAKEEAEQNLKELK